MKFYDLKTEHKSNTNINRLVIHLARCEVDSFRSMKDLAVNLKVLIPRVGCHLTAICYNAQFLPHRKNLLLVTKNLIKISFGKYWI